jgi:hypothetical protein
MATRIARFIAANWPTGTSHRETGTIGWVREEGNRALHAIIMAGTEMAALGR